MLQASLSICVWLKRLNMVQLLPEQRLCFCYELKGLQTLKLNIWSRILGKANHVYLQENSFLD